MTTVDDLWYLAEEASQQAEQTYHSLVTQYEQFWEYETTKRVPRYRFETVARRIEDNGAPYGAHTLTYRETGDLLLVRHEGVDMWVLPGGEADDDERFRDAAERELHEEAGIEASYEGLGLLGRVTFYSGEYSTWGVLPIFEASPRGNPTDLRIEDPDEEISEAAWFGELPEDTRDRSQLQRWRERKFD
ncbi:NUDIX domain-containing protein [Halobacteriaceae archaeon SHR40]|uniref:NUDIX hydrolase n=1 Tax=Halovenus amylolytica TaxID=2500550 RepID=UPI000FE43096